MKVLADMQIADLDAETIHSYRNRHMVFRREHIWEKLSDIEYLERIGAAKLSKEDGQVHPTAAGLLMFGQEYKILYELQVKVSRTRKLLAMLTEEGKIEALSPTGGATLQRI